MSGAHLTISALTAMVLAGSGLAGNAQGTSKLQTAVFSRATQPGEVVTLDVTCGCDAARATATVFGSDVPLVRGRDAGVWHGLIGIDVETAPGTYPMHVVLDRTAQPPLTTTRASRHAEAVSDPAFTGREPFRESACECGGADSGRSPVIADPVYERHTRPLARIVSGAPHGTSDWQLRRA